MAKSKGVTGWHSMRKEQLVRALVKLAKQKASTTKSKSSGKSMGSKSAASKKKPTPLKSSPRNDSRIARKLRQERAQIESLKNLALVNERERTKAPPSKDRVILIVRDPYWLQAYWEITEATVDRVRVALAGNWFETQPVLRLMEVTNDASSDCVETLIREIPIHGGVRNWYMEAPNPPKSFRVALGYASKSGKFHLIAKSNLVTTPTPDYDAFDHNWTDISGDYKKFYAASGGYSGSFSGEPEGELQSIFEEKLRRPMNVPAFVRLGNGINSGNLEFDFEVDAHMVIQGTANPNANVTLAGEPVKLRDDGSFSVRMELPDKRQVLPIVASSRDGTQRRTTVLAVERNTKILEPVSREIEEL